MLHSGRWYVLVAVLTGLALLATPPAARATFSVRVNGTTVSDGDLADGAAAANAISATFSISGATILVAAFTNTPGGAPSFVLMTYAIFALTGGTFTIDASADGFTIPISGGPALLVSTATTTATIGSVTGTAQQWVDLENTLFGMGGGTITPGVQSLASIASAAFTSSTPYSITERVTLTMGSFSVAGGALSSTVPEPATLLVFGAGLAGVGVLAWCRRRNQ